MLALLACSSALTSIRASEADAAAPVRFTETTTLVLGSEPSTIIVVNDSDRAFKVAVTISLFDAKGGTSRVFGVSPRAQILASGRSAAFVVAAVRGSAIVPVSGALALQATAGSITVRMSRAVKASSDLTANPVVKRLSIVSTRRAPFGDRSRAIHTYLPLRVGSGCPAGGETGTATMKSSRRVATSGSATPTSSEGSVAVSDGSRTSQLGYRCVFVGNVPRIIFNASHLGPPGNYTGTLTVGSVDVALEIRRTTSIWWAIATLLLGFLAALYWNTSTTNIQPMSRVYRRLGLHQS